MGKLTLKLTALLPLLDIYYSLCHSFLNKREVSKKTKLTVYKTPYVPTLTYSCESWTLGSQNHSRLQAAEMRYLRRVEQKTRRDRIRNNTTIRKTLNVVPLALTIERAQLQWFGYVLRMYETRLPRRAWEARSEGPRTRGRPRIKWEENIAASLRSRGVQWTEARTKTPDRKARRSLWQTSIPSGTRGPIKYTVRQHHLA